MNTDRLNALYQDNVRKLHAAMRARGALRAELDGSESQRPLDFEERQQLLERLKAYAAMFEAGKRSRDHGA